MKEILLIAIGCVFILLQAAPVSAEACTSSGVKDCLTEVKATDSSDTEPCKCVECNNNLYLVITEYAFDHAEPGIVWGSQCIQICNNSESLGVCLAAFDVRTTEDWLSTAKWAQALGSIVW